MLMKNMDTLEYSSKKPNKTNLIKRVFTKTSSVENSSITEENNSLFSDSSKDVEIQSLKDQVNTLQQSLFSMQEILEIKDKSITNLNREKEKLNAETKKLKRSIINIRQQLEDEREYHMKEKEYYCKEMTASYKYRPKKNPAAHNEEYAALCTDEQKNEIQNLKSEIINLKSSLYDTLEANYNLSIKYLRMKNTKYSIKARFKRYQTEQEKIIFDLQHKLDHLGDELDFVISEKFRQALPSNNKKYLQNLKKYANLTHENLALQVDISKLYNEIEKLKADKLKFDTNSKYKYIKKLCGNYGNKCDKISQTNFDDKIDQEKEYRSLIFKESNFEMISEKSSEVFSEISALGFNKNQFEINKVESAPEILLD